MRHAFLIVLAAVLGAGAATAADAATPPPALRTRADVERRLTETVNRQLELSASIQEHQKKLDEIWQDEHLSAPEMDKLRQQRAVLLQQLAAVDAEMRKFAAQRPEYRAEQQRVDEETAAFRAMSTEIERLRKLRFELP